MRFWTYALIAAALLFTTEAQPQVTSQSTIACSRVAIYDTNASGSTKLVTGTGRPIYICGFTFIGGGTVNVKLVYGSGTNCGTGTVNLTPAFNMIANSQVADQSSFFRGLVVPGAPAATPNDLCINASSGVAIQAIVYYQIQQ